MSHEQVVAIDSDEPLKTMLAEAEPGEQVELTVDGKVVGKAVAARVSPSSDQVQATMDRIARVAAGQTLGGLSIKDLINEGRR